MQMQSLYLSGGQALQTAQLAGFPIVNQSPLFQQLQAVQQAQQLAAVSSGESFSIT